MACNSFNGSYETGNGGLADEWQALEGADPGIRLLGRAECRRPRGRSWNRSSSKTRRGFTCASFSSA